ncbi:exo-alpha-sialidase [Ketogulonicigenium vulgare]|uniref:exo-alpha-sialidase n=1 Tax=Ketogulonicigenium vulgare TaxID=92945 RepID=UPI0023591D8C|nr:exo-alpha-sialidase [Ketogulonicigenium vulgare]
MGTCLVRGLVKDISGEILPGAVITFERSDVVGQGGAMVLPETKTVTVTGDGVLVIDLYPGSYVAKTKKRDGRWANVLVGVPDEAEAELADLIAQQPELTPSLVKQAQGAATTATGAADLADRRAREVAEAALQVDGDAQAVEVARQLVEADREAVAEDRVQTGLDRERVGEDLGETRAARDQTQALRDDAAQLLAAGMTAQHMYDTIALGRAAVSDGDQFGVIANGTDGLTRPTIYRRISATDQVFVMAALTGAELDAEIAARHSGSIPGAFDAPDGAVLDSSDGPRAEILQRGRRAIVQYLEDGTPISSLDTQDMVLDYRALRLLLGSVSLDQLSDIRLLQSDQARLGLGASLSQYDAPHIEDLAAQTSAAKTVIAGDQKIYSIDTIRNLMQLSVALGLDIGGTSVEAHDAPSVEMLPSGRSSAKAIGYDGVELLGFDTKRGGLRLKAPLVSEVLPDGLLAMRKDGALTLSGIVPGVDPDEPSFLTGDNFPELIDSFFVTRDPFYATRKTQMAAAGAITGRTIYPETHGLDTASRLWATFYARQYYASANSRSAEGPDNYVVVAYSDDPQGATGTWHELFYVVPRGAGVNRVYDSFLHNMPNGDLLLTFAAMGGGNTYGTGRTGSYGIIIKNPHGSAQAISTSDAIDLGVGVISQMQPDQDGALYGSLDVWRNPANAATVWRGKWLARLAFDRVYQDNPRPELVSLMPDIPAAAGRTYDETMVVRTRDGGWLALFRSSSSGLYETRFDPVTQAWSTPQPWTAHPNIQAGSRCGLARSPSGRLALVFNRQVSGRGSMSIAFSDDDGLTWPHYYTFDPREGLISYPIVSFDRIGNAHVVYDYWRGQNNQDVKDIIWVTIPEQSVIDGSPTHTTNFVSQ